MLKIDKVEIKWDVKTIDELQEYNLTPEAKSILKRYGYKARDLVASRIPDNQTGKRYNTDRKINSLLKVSAIRQNSFTAHNERFKSSSIVLSMPTNIKRYFYAAAGRRRGARGWVYYKYSSPTAKSFPFNDLYSSGFMDRFHNDWQTDFKNFLKKKLD